MIRFCRFSFEEYPCENHWAEFAKFGACTGSFVRFYPDYKAFDWSLERDEAWQISFDQSTTNSGIFLKNYRNTIAYMIEVHRDKGQDADAYIFEFEQFIHKLCDECKFTHLIYERPITTEGFRSSQVLFQLEGMLRALVRRYPEFKTATLDCIENASWRSVVIDSKLYGGLTRKNQSKNALIDIYPWVRGYGDSIGTDNDVFEAMGVMFGWFICSYDNLGRPYVRGDRYPGNIGGFVLPMVSAKEVAEQLNEIGIKAEWRMQNPRKSTYENIAAAVEKYKVMCVEITDPATMLALCVECNVAWMEPDKMTIILVTANYMDRRLFEITGKEYHFVF